LNEEYWGRQYRNHRNIDSPVRDNAAPCDEACRLKYFCETSTNDYAEWRECLGNPFIWIPNDVTIL